MPPITALLHTENDALRLGRTLETLLPCAEFLIVDHHSTDATRRVACQYGAKIVSADKAAPPHHYLDLARHDWILCLQPGESLNENLQASLFEWTTRSSASVADGTTFSVFVREQIGDDWVELPAPQTRLLSRGWKQWRGHLPVDDPSATALEGELLRFSLP